MMIGRFCLALAAPLLVLSFTAPPAAAEGPLKLVRFGPRGAEKPGLIDADGVIRDLSGHVDDIDGAALSPESLARIRAIDTASLPAAQGNPRLGPPLANVGKIVAIGLNYRAHVAEGGGPTPTEPILFMKATTAITGPNDPIVIPKGSSKTDWETELGVVIGTVARYVSEDEALDHVAGYLICEDGSERDFQRVRGGQFTKGKSADTFAPLGPWLLTADGVPDPQTLNIWLDLNGERKQSSNTSYMIFGVRFAVAYISQFMTLAPGDVICTGTPEGVGFGQKPPRFLRPGDVLHLGIDGLGEQTHEVRAYGE